MSKPSHPLFVGGRFRANGERQGVCHKKDSMGRLSCRESEVQDRKLEGVGVAVMGCLNVSTGGPVMNDYPGGNFCRVPNTDAIDAILDAIESDSVVSDYQIHI